MRSRQLARPIHGLTYLAVALIVALGACSSGEENSGETITSASQTTAPTTATPTSGDRTTTEQSTTTAAPTTSVTEEVRTTLLEVDNPPLVDDALPLEAPDVAYIWDGNGGVHGPNGTEDWSTSAEPGEGFLGGWLHVAPGPDGSLWRSRLLKQTQDCAQLTLDISKLTSPNALDFALSLPYTSQPNCAQDVLWPAGYSESFLVTEGGLVLLYLDQEPRDGCAAPECVPEVVVSIEFRPFEALGAQGIRFIATRTAMDADGRDPELARRVLNDFARLGAASVDQGTFVLDRTNLILALGSTDGTDVPIGAIPAYDGEGFFFTSGGTDGTTSSEVIFADPAGDLATLFVTDQYFVELLADHPDFLILNLVQFEDSGLAFYDKSAGILYNTGLGGLPGVGNAYVRGEANSP